MSTTSAVYKHLETTDASLQANQLIREVAFATDKDALTYKTEGGVFKYFRNSTNDATTDGILKIESGVYVNAVPGVDYLVSGNYVPYTGAVSSVNLDSYNISANELAATSLLRIKDIKASMEDWDWPNYTSLVVSAEGQNTIVGTTWGYCGGSNFKVIDGEMETTSLEATTITADNIIISDDIYSDEWRSHTPATLVGWSSCITSAVYVKRVGKTVFVSFNFDGTSNSDNTYFNLPNDCVAPTQTNKTLWIVNNGVAAIGNMGMGGVNYYTLNFGVGPCRDGWGNWTTSGVKSVAGELFYETN
jgi:hypothetical protein